LKGDRSNFGPDDRGYTIRGDVRLIRDSPQNGQTLSGDLNPALTKEISRFGGHPSTISTI